MLNQEVTELAGTMILVQFEERRKQLKREVEWVHNEMAERGISRSGITLARIHELCLHEVEIQARIKSAFFATIWFSSGRSGGR